MEAIAKAWANWNLAMAVLGNAMVLWIIVWAFITHRRRSQHRKEMRRLQPDPGPESEIGSMGREAAWVPPNSHNK